MPSYMGVIREHPGRVCLQRWPVSDVDPQGLSPTWSFANLPRPYHQMKKGGGTACRGGLIPEDTQPTCESPLPPASSASSEMLCDVPLTTTDFPANVLC